MFRSISTHGDERNALTLIIASNSLRARVESQNSIDQESIAVMTMLEFNSQQPGAIGHLFHRIGLRVPLVEIADETDGLGLWRVADEIDCSERLFVMVSKTHKLKDKIRQKLY